MSVTEKSVCPDMRRFAAKKSTPHGNRIYRGVQRFLRGHWVGLGVIQRSLGKAIGYWKIIGQGQRLLRGYWVRPEVIERLLAQAREVIES